METITQSILKLVNDLQTYLKQSDNSSGIIYLDKDSLANSKILASYSLSLSPPPLSSQAIYDKKKIILTSKKDYSVKSDSTQPTIKTKVYKFKPFESTSLFTEQPSWQKSVDLNSLFSQIHNCVNCTLGYSRKNFVFGSGNPNADIMIIGEAPGADEDEQGLPFVGRAGQLLTKILESINIKREEVYIANILKCRPPGNRNPLPNEVDECEPYLMKQIELIQPEFILVLGLTALDTLFKQKHKMSDIRGKVLDFHGIKTLATYHPAALLRNPHWKKLVWEDVKFFKNLYDEYLQSIRL